MTAWERKLRPQKASGWRLGTWLIVGNLVVAWIAIKPVTPREAATEFKVANVAPATESTLYSLGLAPALTAPTTAQAPGITKCLGSQGAVEYTDGACRTGLRPVKAALPVLTIADGMTQQERLASQRANQIKTQHVFMPENQAVPSMNRTSNECRTLDAAIAAYDTEARQPLPTWRQDRLREMRKAIWDRQSSLRF